MLKLSPTLNRTVNWPLLSLWGCLGVIIVAELLTMTVDPALGAAIYALLLLAMLLQSTLGAAGPASNLMLALVLMPLLRLLSLTMPVALKPIFRLFIFVQPPMSFDQLSWYPMIAVPLLLATFLIIRLLGVSQRDLGWRLGNPFLQIGFALGGVGLGVLEYMILAPAPLTFSVEQSEILRSSIVLVLFTGLTEELIFRGLLQSLAVPALGRWGITYVAVLFAAMHIGYLSVLQVGIVFIVGLIFGVFVSLTGSILGVSIAHYLTNLTLFVLLPWLFRQATPQEIATVGRFLGVLTSIGTGVFCLIVAFRLTHITPAIRRRDNRKKSRAPGRHLPTWLTFGSGNGDAPPTRAELEQRQRSSWPTSADYVVTRYSVPEAAARLGVTEAWVRRRIESGMLLAERQDDTWIVLFVEHEKS